MIETTTKKLEARLLEMRGSHALSFTAETTPAMRLTSNPFRCPHCRLSVVRKIAHVNGLINVLYEKAVNRQRAREAAPGRPRPYKATSRAWGDRVETTPLIEYHGRLYLNLKRQTVVRCEYRILGELATPEQIDLIERLLIDRSGEGKRQGLKKPVIWRDYALEAITRIKMEGEDYLVKPGRKRRSQK